MTWQAPTGYLDALRAELASSRDSAVAQRLELLGRLVAAGESIDTFATRRFEWEPGVFRELGQCTDKVIERLAGLDATHADDETWQLGASTDVRRALEERDRAHFVLLALRRLAPGVVVSEDDLAVVYAFDELLRPELWRFTHWNDVRAERERFIAPQHRRGWWWRFDAVSVPPIAWRALPAVAALVARFSEARIALEHLAAVEGALVALRSGADTERSARVISLGEWLERRMSKGAELAAAAAPLTDEALVHSDAVVEIAWRSPDELIVYVLDEQALRTAPIVTLPGETMLAMARTPDNVGRFSLALGPDALDATVVRVRIPTRQGAHDVRLPPAEP